MISLNAFKSILKRVLALSLTVTVQFLAPLPTAYADHTPAQATVDLQSQFWSWQPLEFAQSILNGAVEIQASADFHALEQTPHILFEGGSNRTTNKLFRGLDFQPVEFYKLAYRIPDQTVFTAVKVQLRILFQQNGLQPPSSLSQNLDSQMEAQMMRFIQDQACLEWLTNSN